MHQLVRVADRLAPSRFERGERSQQPEPVSHQSQSHVTRAILVQPIRVLVLVLVLQTECPMKAMEYLLLFPALPGDGLRTTMMPAVPEPAAHVHLHDEKGQ